MPVGFPTIASSLDLVNSGWPVGGRLVAWPHHLYPVGCPWSGSLADPPEPACADTDTPRPLAWEYPYFSPYGKKGQGNTLNAVPRVDRAGQRSGITVVCLHIPLPEPSAAN